MKIAFSPVAAFALACCMAFPVQGVELFNGKDLTGWYKFLQGSGRDNDPKGVISVTNGVIRITGEVWGALVSEAEYSDYRLDVEYRWTGKKWPSKANRALDSGILFHSTGPDGGFGGIWMFSHELNVIFGATGDIWTVGSRKNRPDMFVKSTARRVTDGKRSYLVYDPKGEEVTLTGNMRLARLDIDPSWEDAATARAAANERPVGEWNTATLVCRGAETECWFNGKFVNRATVSPSRGRIQLQSEGCEVEYRRVTLTPLKDGGVSAARTFGAAKWLWPRDLGAVTNTTVEFRTRFTSGKAVPLELAIAADTVYAVELNGRFVHSGRFPDVPPQRYYDTLPIGAAKAGENELKVSLYVQGVDSFQTLPGDPGVMFALSGEDVRVASGDATEWRLSTRDRREGVPLVTSQLGFSFEYDAAKPEAEWRPIAASDAVRGTADFALEARPASRVEILPDAPARIVAQGRLDGSSVPDAVAPGMDGTPQTAVGADEFFTADGKGVRDGFFRDGFYVIVDLGRETAGFLSLDVDTDEGVVIDVGHAEHMENGRIRTFIGKRNFAGRYRAREGRQRYFRWARRMAGRYIQLHVRGVRTHFALQDVTVKPAEFPVMEFPPPSALTERQRRIWDTSVRTLRLCMHEHYEDCPWREQALYGNDSRNQMLCGYHAFGAENRMPELALQVLGRGLGADGWIELCMPAKISITIPSFAFCWVLAVDDNLRYRCDTAFVRTLMPTVRKLLDTHLAEVRDGLLPCPEGKRYWQFYEWAPGLDGSFWSGMKTVRAGERRIDAPLNLFFVLALEAGANCADATDDAETAKRWRDGAAEIRRAVTARFWNADRNQMETALGAKCASELVQSLALLADAVPAEARSAVARKLSAPSEWTEITLSQTLYKYEALLAAGVSADSVIRMVDGEWSKMLDQGATSFWEMREGWSAFGDAGSLCHGWSAVPVYIYGKYLK